MQNAKNTFYEVLRARLAALNPARTLVVRGVMRPGVLVEENELATALHLPDCFRLRWTKVEVESQSRMPRVTMQCTLDYATAGSAGNGGMDRGRSLAAMDAELQSALSAWPQRAVKNNYSGLASGSPPAAMSTNIWWGDVAFGMTNVKDDRLERSATVAVMSYQESGEL